MPSEPSKPPPIVFWGDPHSRFADLIGWLSDGSDCRISRSLVGFDTRGRCRTASGKIYYLEEPGGEVMHPRLQGHLYYALRARGISL